MNNITTQFCRIVTSQKLDDRFLTAQKLSITDEELLVPGDLYALVEINKPWFPISQIGSRILSVFQKNYYKGDSTSDLVNFEKSIKEVNQTLVRLTEQGETDWIGNLNAALIANINQEMHIATAGSVKALLVREGKILSVNQPDDTLDQNPIKTFDTITSGTLLPEDTLLVANSHFFDFVDSSKIKEIIDNSPSCYESAREMVKIFKKNKVKTINTLLIRPTNIPIDEEEPDVVYIDQSPEKLGEKLLKWWQQKGKQKTKQLGSNSLLMMKKAHTVTKEKILPRTALTLKSISKRTGETVRKTWDKTQPFIENQSNKLSGAIDSAITGIKQKNDNDQISSDPSISIIGKNLYTIHDYQSNQEKSSQKFTAKIFYKIKITIYKIWFNSIRLIRFLITPSKKPLLIIIITLLLIVILIASIALRKSKQAATIATKNQNATLESAKQHLSDAKTAIVFGDTKNSQVLFGQAIQESESLLNTPLAEKAKEITSQAQVEYDKLTGTSRIKNPLLIGSVTEKSFVAIVENKGYLVSIAGEIQEISLAQNSAATSIANIGNNEQPVAYFSTIENKILIATKNQNLYEFKPSDKTVTKLAPADGDKFSPSKAIGMFLTNIYLLDNDNDQIWKYTQTNDGIKAAQKYLPRSQIDLAKAIDITIDGAIYIIYADGKVNKLLKGEKQEFGLTNIPKPFDVIKQPLKIYTQEDSPSIYVVDNGEHRILEFDKNGVFFHQYVLPADFKDIASAAFQIKSKRVFLINKDKLFQIEL